MLQRRCGEWRCRCFLNGLDGDVGHFEGGILAHLQELECLASFGESGVELGGERSTLAFGLKLSRNTVVRFALEVLDLVLALGNEPHCHALDSSGRQCGLDLLPQHGRQLKPHDAVEHASCLLCVDQVAVDGSWLFDSLQDGGLGNLVEDDALGVLGLEPQHFV